MRAVSMDTVPWIYWMIVTLFTVHTGGQMPGAGQPEYCQMDTFEASCHNNQVLVMTKAQYGRMALGRCVHKEYGAMDCSANVLDRVDRLCSGRKECDFFVGTLHGTQPCPVDLSAYLQVEYHCQQVESAPHASCLEGSTIRVSSPSGFLANTVTMESKKGSHTCPWLIQGEPGQRINVTLINFARIGENGDSSDSGLNVGSRPRICYQYVTLTEGNYERTVTECEGAPRESQVYTSTSHKLQLEILTRKSSDVYFLLKYEIFGCPDLPAHQGTWTKRVNDHVTVTCNSTGDKWLLTCKNGKWAGTQGNCTPPDSSNSWNLSMLDQPLSTSFPYGILVVVAVGVALGVFLGGILLICASRYYKRQRQRNLGSGGGDPRYHPAAYVLDESKLEPYPQTPDSMTDTHKYTTDSKKQRMMAPPYGPYGTLPPGYHHPGTAHIYESPQQGHRDSV